MKMVSQLTRQAMNRHRLASINLPTVSPLPAPSPDSPPPAASSMHPAALDARPVPLRSEPRQEPLSAPAPQPRTIYQQLMASHDRMRERHIRT